MRASSAQTRVRPHAAALVMHRHNHCNSYLANSNGHSLAPPSSHPSTRVTPPPHPPHHEQLGVTVTNWVRPLVGGSHTTSP